MAMSSTVWGPTFQEMLHPGPPEAGSDVVARLAAPNALFDISWRDPSAAIRCEVLPRELTGVKPTIVVLTGRDFPSGSHKVGAAYSILVEKQLAGLIEPGRHRLVWPSTGNFGIGGAWIGGRMGYQSIVVLPENMSQERFDLLASYGASIEKTSGSESNVHEIYYRTRELQQADPEHVVVLNQFMEMGNYRFHYYVTGNTIVELAAQLYSRGIGNGKVALYCSAMGSGGTIAAGDRLKQVWPTARTVGLEPIQCPTLYNAGYGSHEIQGIGDKHVTWIHNVLNMDAIAAIDDQACLNGLRLLNEESGQKLLTRHLAISEERVQQLSTVFGISGVCNVLGAIKMARHYELGADELVVTICTDGVQRYHSVLANLRQQHGSLDEPAASEILNATFHGQNLDWIAEGTPLRRQRWQNQKYYTWVEQLGKTVAELTAQNDPDWWLAHQAMISTIDQDIRQRRVASL